MTFLNVAMLFGTAAAAIPVLIHLFHRQRVSTVDFSSIAFIRQLNLRQSRALKLRRLLLLLVRTLIILAAAFAFARPAVQGALASLVGTGVHQKTAVAIVLDDSYSMRVGDGATSSFSYARETALRIADRLQSGDEGVVVFTGVPSRAVPERPVYDLDRIHTVLEEATASAGSGDIGAAMTLASSLLANTTVLNREIYLITDLQRHDWQALIDGTGAPKIDAGIDVFVLPVSPPSITNASIDAVTVGGHLVERKRPERVTATVTNRSAAPMRDRTVSLYLDGVKRGNGAVSMDPGQIKTSRFELTIQYPGHYAGYVELDHDDLALDNRRYFTLTIPDRIKVLVVAARESGYFLEQVLSPRGATATPVDVARASPRVLDGTDFGDTHVIVLDGNLPLSSTQLVHLDRFVTSGGGLIVFLGEGVKASPYNRNLLPEIFACTIAGQVGAPGQRKSYVSLDRVDYGHPLFDMFHRKEGRLPDAPRFFSSYRLSLTPRARVVARFSDGVPAIVEGRRGRGRALLIASTLNPGWSDLPLKSLFVPLMHRSVRYVHPDFDAADNEIRVGTPVERDIDVTKPDAPVMVRRPSGATEWLKPTVSRGGTSVTVSRTEEPGIYRIESGGRLLTQFAVNVDTKESVFDWIDPRDVGRLLHHESVRILEPTAALEQDVLQSRQGYEIWRFLLWIVLGLIVLESLLTRMPVKTAH